MRTVWTLSFPFSSSYAERERIRAYNFILHASLEGLSGPEFEQPLKEKIENGLIHKIHSKDLGLHVDFLKGLELNEEVILNAFWDELNGLVAPARLRTLTLERDDRTKITREA